MAHRRTFSHPDAKFGHPSNKTDAVAGGKWQDSKLENVPYRQTPASSLMVFRNQQGVFLPGMSDNAGIQIWRILKNGAAPGDKINVWSSVGY
ncbi:hypothetical protein BHE90_012828 [Fusarium euwallaceae]|uniref:Uncharacterized protein n=1 Tax=Fusarium euwallaceae TaxID=1147111 RepID=A0A430LAG5_9HYPO|nr:hypothetical protein BHE90_012828 [Fusarium euwallaceae]